MLKYVIAAPACQSWEGKTTTKIAGELLQLGLSGVKAMILKIETTNHQQEVRQRDKFYHVLVQFR